jgi:hypothetical protein
VGYFFIQLIKPEYNLTPTAHNTHGYKHSIETITKMKANYSDDLSGRREFAREINKDKALSAEAKAKLSKARNEVLGKIPSNARPVIVYDALLMTRIAIFPSIARAAKFRTVPTILRETSWERAAVAQAYALWELEVVLLMKLSKNNQLLKVSTNYNIKVYRI